MTCFNPVYAWRADKPNENGKYPMEFQAKGRLAMDSIPLPCGKCIGCAMDKSRTWASRMYHESLFHEQNSFLTLTYSDNSQTTLEKRHLQLFFKRLRKHYQFRYFAVGEYGDQTYRPHYHAIFFGQDFLAGSYKVNDDLYANKILDSLWGHGNVVCAEVTEESCAYVAGYACKKVTGEKKPMKPLMSSKPGIGANWIEKHWPEVAANGCVVVGDQERDVPKAYIARKARELDHIADVKKKRVREFTHEQLASRKANLMAKLKLKVETL